MDLRDRSQELRAVLRYNNSMAYAANVLSWSAAYRSGGSPQPVRISPDLVAPGSLPPVGPGSEMAAVTTTAPGVGAVPGVGAAPRPVVPRQQVPTQVMITIPGLPPIPCGIFCPPPPPANPCAAQPLPAPMPFPDLPGTARVPLAPGQTYGGAPADPRNAGDPAGAGRPADAEMAGQPGTYGQQAAGCTQPDTTLTTAEPAPIPGDSPDPDNAPRGDTEPAVTTPPAPEPEPAPDAQPVPTPPPAITLPFGIVIPLPAPPAPPQQ
ncbi:hypothetical protein ACRS6B_12590 [Nocardia asteroides]